MPEYMCKNCGYTFVRYNTAQRLCPKCQYNKYAKPKKPIKRMGKKAEAWIIARAAWIKNHPANHQGYWECYLQTTNLCPRWIDIDQLTLDHVTARSSDGKNTDDNIKPACVYCNGDKGSLSLDNYLKGGK